MNHPLLALADVTVAFGGVRALDGLCLSVPAGQICALIGANGAGKTTLLDVISGVRPLDRGSVRLQGRAVTGLPCHEVARLGVARTFQQLALFEQASVQDNIRTGGHQHLRAGFVSQLLRLPRARREEAELSRRAQALAAEVGVAGLAHRAAWQLSYGQRKRVELARALAARPALLLLDEPAAGLDDEEVARLPALIRAAARQHEMTILMVEHHLPLVTAVADRAVRLEAGRLMDDGPPATVCRRMEAESFEGIGSAMDTESAAGIGPARC